MPIKTNSERSEADTTTTPYVGGSARGWSFISTGLRCWWAWMLRYVANVVESVRPDYFDVGSVMHALHEGRSMESIVEEFKDPSVVELGRRLYEIRMREGAPLPEATAVEKTIEIFGGQMTSKPDRIEKDGARDFKSAMMFSKHDDASWGVDGGIIGEAIAANVRTVLVDITKKPSRDDDGREREAAKPTKVVRVTVTERKRKALEVLVDGFWTEVEGKVASVIRPSRKPPDLEKLFPRNLAGCVGKYGTCPYYARCWGSPPESLMYRAGAGTHRWAETPVKGKKGLTKDRMKRFIFAVKGLLKEQKL